MGEGVWKKAVGLNKYGDALRQYRAYLSWLEKERNCKPLLSLEQEESMAGGGGKLVNNWLVGCDPEFVVLKDDGSLLKTDDIIPQHGPVGWDHSGYVVETRPKPARGTYAVLRNIQVLLLRDEGLKRLLKFKWRAGAYVKAKPRGVITLGGHVHLDIPPPNSAEGDSEEHESVITACDRWTQVLEGLDILPAKESLARRKDPTAVRNKYGQFGDWRPAAHEGGEHIEYRTMASWLFDPKVAFLAMTGAKLAAVAPASAIALLKPSCVSWKGMCGFLELFRHKDTNARRALEKLCDGREVGGLQVDPDCNFRERWESLGV